MKVYENFLRDEERVEAIKYIESLKPTDMDIENEHIKNINDHINGFSVACDMTDTPELREVSSFQGDATKVYDGVPQLFYDLKDRIVETLNIDDKHVFLQFIYMDSGGRVIPHYDAAIDGYVTYKCNISVQSTGDIIHVDKESVLVEEKSLYCFEASLFRHWVDKCDSKRLLISYGFLIPYADLGWDSDCARVRMSRRITSFFQKRLK